MNMNLTKVQQAGSVILEALIAILIFSIGILALVGMQASAINSVSDAKYRSTAGFLAEQIVGMIRANSTTTLGPNGWMVDNVSVGFACIDCSTTTPPLNGNTWTQAWMTSGVAANLPNGAASIVINAATADVTVSVFWQSPKDPSVHQHIVSTVVN